MTSTTHKISVISGLGMLSSQFLPWKHIGVYATQQGYNTMLGGIITIAAITVSIVSIIQVLQKQQGYTRFYLFVGVACLTMCCAFVINTFFYGESFEELNPALYQISPVEITGKNSIGYGVFVCLGFSLLLSIFSFRTYQHKNAPPPIPASVP